MIGGEVELFPSLYIPEGCNVCRIARFLEHTTPIGVEDGFARLATNVQSRCDWGVSFQVFSSQRDAMFVELRFPPGTYDPDRGRRWVLACYKGSITLWLGGEDLNVTRKSFLAQNPKSSTTFYFSYSCDFHFIRFLSWFIHHEIGASTLKYALFIFSRYIPSPHTLWPSYIQLPLTKHKRNLRGITS